MTDDCLVRQDFDSAAFGRPFFRMRRFDADRLPVELAAHAAHSDVMVDAKLPADRVEQSLFLQRLGFRKVSTQIALSRRVDGAEHGEDGARISARLALAPEEIARHAANFVYDRFALDIAIDRAGHDAFFARWIANSLSGARHRIADRPGGFLTFRDEGDALRIDLLSVLDKGKGIGRGLLRAVLAHGGRLGRARVDVVTECENRPAIRLYLALGFVPVGFQSALHFGRPSTHAP
jgi:GNAT superfamily N-acetyltransferase